MLSQFQLHLMLKNSLSLGQAEQKSAVLEATLAQLKLSWVEFELGLGLRLTNKCVLKWLGKVQCFKPMFFLFCFVFVENSTILYIYVIS